MPSPKLKKIVMESPTVSKLTGEVHHKLAAPTWQHAVPGRQTGLNHVMQSGGCLASERG